MEMLRCQLPSTVFQRVFHVIQDGWKWLPAWRHGAEQCCWWRRQNSRGFSPTWPLLLGKDSGDGSVIVETGLSSEAILVWSFWRVFGLSFQHVSTITQPSSDHLQVSRVGRHSSFWELMLCSLQRLPSNFPLDLETLVEDWRTYC